jgi:hypothetical protein
MKSKMNMYLQSINFDLWLSIENETHRPIKIGNGIEITKTRIEYIDNNKNFLFMNAKTMNTLYYALSISEFNKITSCKNDKDI